MGIPDRYAEVFALENPAHQPLIADELETLDTAKARKIAQRINDQMLKR